MFFRYIIFNCDIFCSREGFGSHSMFLKWSNKYKGYIGLDITWRNQNGFCPGGIIRIALISYLLSLCLLCPRHLHSLIFYMVYYLILVLCAKLLLSCPTLCHPMDCSPAGSSVHGILQVRILEWVATPACRGYSQHRDGTHILCCSYIAGGFFTTEPPGEPRYCILTHIYGIFKNGIDEPICREGMEM